MESTSRESRFGALRSAVLDVRLTRRQAEMIGAEVEAGRYTSASELDRELVRALGWAGL